MDSDDRSDRQTQATAGENSRKRQNTSVKRQQMSAFNKQIWAPDKGNTVQLITNLNQHNVPKLRNMFN